MKTALVLLLAISTVLAQSCSFLDVGTYTCSINHPGHGTHDATLVIGNTSSFSYVSDRSSENCIVSGDYSISSVNDTLTLSSINSNNIGCIIDSNSTTTVIYFDDCNFNSGCNRFSCESRNSEGTTDFSCDINDNNNNNNNNDNNDNSSAATLSAWAGILATVFLF